MIVKNSPGSGSFHTGMESKNSIGALKTESKQEKKTFEVVKPRSTLAKVLK